MKKQSKKAQHLKTLLKKEVLAIVVAIVVPIALMVLGSLLTSDPCLDDWDIECTEASVIARTIYTIGFMTAAFVQIGVLPVLLVAILVTGILLVNALRKDKR